MATYDLTSSIPSKIKTGDILNCPYSGSAKFITLPKGQYKLECWGAQGGNAGSYQGGYGGYSAGILTLSDKTSIYLQTGGQGSSSSTTGGYNGGGTGISSGRGGGGASDIRIGQNSLYARVLVAGGGGGSGVQGGYSGKGAGGGTSGLDGYSNNVSTTGANRAGGGGSQTTGGISWQSIASTKGSFGQGGSASGYSCGGGGSGWYGGGGAYDSDYDADGRNGGGGSGYVYTSSTASNYPSGCLLKSSYYLISASTIAGNTVFTSPTGTSETGHTGDGYIRITVIEAQGGKILFKESEGTWLEQKQMFVNTGASSTVSSGLVELDYIESNGTQYIDTGCKASKNLKVEAELNVSAASGWVMILGDYTSGSYFSWWRKDTTMYAYYGSNNKTLAEQTGKRKYIANNTNNIWSIDSSSVTVSPNSSDFSKNGGNLYLFSVNNGGNYNKASMKFYSCKIYDNGTLVRDFIPAKRTSDGICGLWDKVSYRFYVDKNGGNFTAGTEKSVIASVGTPIEYIQSSGTQYINTNYIPNTKTKIIADFQVTAKQASNNDIIGVYGQFSFRQYGNADYFRTVSGTAISDFDTSVSILDRHIVEKAYNSTKVDNDYVYTLASDITFSYPVYLFAYNTGSSVANQGFLKLYSCKIYDGNVLVRDFIPIKTTVNTYGLWDKVNKVFYKNSGTGTFTGGSTVTLSGWRPAKGIWTKTDSSTWTQVL